jgi:hypothetical protein
MLTCTTDLPGNRKTRYQMQKFIHNWPGGLRRYCALFTTGNHLHSNMVMSDHLRYSIQTSSQKCQGQELDRNIKGKRAEVRSTPRNLGSRLSQPPVTSSVVQPSPLHHVDLFLFLSPRLREPAQMLARSVQEVSSLKLSQDRKSLLS